MVNAVIIKRSEVEESRWNTFVQSSPQQSIYLNTWYLDAVCDEWMAVIVIKNDQWVAVMPINSKRKLSLHYLLQPHFAQFMGIAFAGDMKLQKRPHEDHKVIMKAIINVLPESAKLINFNFHPSIDYLMPFHWSGFTINARYTYWLPLSNTMEVIRSNYSKSLKNELNLASKKNLRCVESESIDELTTFLKSRDIISDEGRNTLISLWKEVNKYKKGIVLHALDDKEVLHGAAAFLMDRDRLIYFQGSAAGIEKNGANSFLIDQAIAKAHDNSNMEYFDFEGSMIESIDHYFRSYRPTLKTYYAIKKNTLPSWVKMSLDLKNKLGGK